MASRSGRVLGGIRRRCLQLAGFPFELLDHGLDREAQMRPSLGVLAQAIRALPQRGEPRHSFVCQGFGTPSERRRNISDSTTVGQPIACVVWSQRTAAAESRRIADLHP